MGPGPGPVAYLSLAHSTLWQAQPEETLGEHPRGGAHPNPHPPPVLGNSDGFFSQFVPGILGNPKRILSAGRLDSVLAQFSGEAVISRLILVPLASSPCGNFQRQISTHSARFQLLKARQAISREEAQGARNSHPPHLVSLPPGPGLSRA